MDGTLSEPKSFSLPGYYEIMKQQGAREFLQSVGRNSKSTRETYAAGLLAFVKFLYSDYDKYTLATIIVALQKNEVDLYVLLNNFVSYLMNSCKTRYGTPLTVCSITSYMAAVRSYLQFHDVDIVIPKFKRKVKMPKLYYEDEEALDAADIRKILLSCTNRRLKPFLLVLATAGLRASEACAIRLCDIDFNVHPVKVHVRKEYSKMRVARDVYISDEATRFLKEWLSWKYRARKVSSGKTVSPIQQDSDLVFTYFRIISDARVLYDKIRQEFATLLKTVGFSKYKEGMQRRTITLHSFRRYVKTVISDQVSKDYSEWFLGHCKSPYYTMKESMRREIYQTKCMSYLTFLDYTALEDKGKSFEARLEQKDQEIMMLKQQMNAKEIGMATFQEALMELRREMDKLKQAAGSDSNKK